MYRKKDRDRYYKMIKSDEKVENQMAKNIQKGNP